MTQTILKITAINCQDGNTYIGCTSSKQNDDALISLLDKEIIIEHEGRTFVKISNN